LLPINLSANEAPAKVLIDPLLYGLGRSVVTVKGNHSRLIAEAKVVAPAQASSAKALDAGREIKRPMFRVCQPAFIIAGRSGRLKVVSHITIRKDPAAVCDAVCPLDGQRATTARPNWD